MYGLVDLDQVIQPYDHRVDRDRDSTAWGRGIVDKLSRLTPIREVGFLAGGNYLKRIPFGPEWTGHDPCFGMRTGKRNGWYARVFASLGIAKPEFRGPRPGQATGRRYNIGIRRVS